MKVIFFGTPKFAADILTYLFEKKINIVAVVTQSDVKKNGRKYISDVKKVASLYLDKSEIYQPEKASNVDFIESLKKYGADLFIVVAYGQILKQNLLDIPKLSSINVHASLLPKYRGAAPIQHSILSGDKVTGITIQKMALKLDTGPIILQKEIEIPNDMIYTQLQDQMCLLAKPLLLEVIELFKKNAVTYTDQDETRVTYAHKITKEIKAINFENSAQKIYDQIKAFALKPGAFCNILINDKKKELKIFSCKILDISLKPKETTIENNSLIVGSSDKAIELIDVQLEGKKKMRAQDFIKGVQKISFQ
ncbi:MAG: Methionyl-tRNA formyltransferase [Candidatus Anoxychlamydiales bacterium]|nr:Methionyl-tRNA formyltransferase [Candidatus Anoxychlamydiales bacterium]